MWQVLLHPAQATKASWQLGSFSNAAQNESADAECRSEWICWCRIPLRMNLLMPNATQNESADAEWRSEWICWCRMTLRMNLLMPFDAQNESADAIWRSEWICWCQMPLRMNLLMPNASQNDSADATMSWRTFRQERKLRSVVLFERHDFCSLFFKIQRRLPEDIQTDRWADQLMNNYNLS